MTIDKVDKCYRPRDFYQYSQKQLDFINLKNMKKWFIKFKTKGFILIVSQNFSAKYIYIYI